MRKLAIAAAIVCLAPAGLGFGPPAVVESEQALAPLYAEQVATIQRSQPPSLSAASAVLTDERSGSTLFARDPTKQRAMASTTKMMTALLALERGQLEKRVRVDVDAAKLIDSSVMGLRPGEELTLEDLLYGLLLPSGNDAALAIAEYIGGSVPQFVALMNQRAAELGMTNTHFVNPHGLDDPAHYSSAADLVLLARAAMRNPTFARIVNTRERTVRGKLATYQLRNTNRLLGSYQGVDGVKTGETDAAGQCLVATAKRGDERVYTTVLGSTDRFSDTKALLDYYYGRFACRYLEMPASAFLNLKPGPAEEVDGGSGTPEGNGDGGLALMQRPWDCRPAWQVRWLRAEPAFTEAGQGGGSQSTGKVTFYLGDTVVAEAPMVAR